MVKEIDVMPDFTPKLVRVNFDIPAYQESTDKIIKEGRLPEKQNLLDFLESMQMIRTLEEMIIALRFGSYAPLPKYDFYGATHLSIGHEAVQTGATAALSSDDKITSTHRGHGDGMAKTSSALKQSPEEHLIEWIKPYEHLNLDGNLLEKAIKVHIYRTIAELFGKEDGYCKGRGGGMHIADFSHGHLGANAIVSGSMPMASGAGVAIRYYKTMEIKPDNIGDVVLCFAGDGAYNNGRAHESMNWTTQAQWVNGLMSKKFGVPTIYIIVNNQYGMTGQQKGELTGIEYLAQRGIAYTDDGMHAEIINGMDVLAVYEAVKKAVGLCKEGHGPVLLDFECYRFKGHSLSDDGTKYRSKDEASAWGALDPLMTFPKKLIEAGIITEREWDELKQKVEERNASMAKKAAESADPDPKNISLGLHADTTSDIVPEKYRNVNILTGKVGNGKFKRDAKGMITYSEAFREAIIEEMDRDIRTTYHGEDIANGYGGAFGHTAVLFERYGRDRVYNTPISESNIVGSAVGMALLGLRPIFEIMYCDFILEAGDQWGNQASKWPYMSGGQCKLPIVGVTTIGGNKGYAGQHSQSLETLTTHIPGSKVIVPSTPEDVKGLIKSAIRDDNPVWLYLHQLSLKEKGVVPEEEYLIPIGKAAVRREGKDITIISWSYMMNPSMEAAEKLSQEGINAEVIDLRTLVPLDTGTIISSVQKTGRVVIVHQAVKRSGYGAEISALIQENAFDYLNAPIIRVASPDIPSPMAKSLELAYLPNAQKIYQAAKEILR